MAKLAKVRAEKGYVRLEARVPLNCAYATLQWLQFAVDMLSKRVLNAQFDSYARNFLVNGIDGQLLSGDAGGDIKSLERY
jgi:hypothetical protein